MAMQARVDDSYVMWKCYIYFAFLCSKILEICKNLIAPEFFTSAGILSLVRDISRDYYRTLQ
jgi:hypothetical protein